MNCKPRQRDIVILDFEPSKGYEVRKRRPALVLSKDTYNSATNLIIVCPITTSDKERPFLVPVQSYNLKTNVEKISKVNTLQVFSLDYTKQANRNVKYIDTLDEEVFFDIAQRFLKNFSFPI